MKPPYKVVSVAEIKSKPWNGFNVVSTFAGGGGSSCGYRMDGYRVVWVNDFIPEALEVAPYAYSFFQYCEFIGLVFPKTN